MIQNFGMYKKCLIFFLFCLCLFSIIAVVKSSQTFENLPGWIIFALLTGVGLIVAAGTRFRVQAQKYIFDLKENDTKYSALINNSADLSYRTNADGKINFVSPSVYKLSGYTIDEAIGMKMAEEVYAIPEQRDAFLAALAEKGIVTDFEARLKRKDGTTWWASTNAHFYKDDDGNVIGVEGITRDITERKLTEKALLESENKMRSIFRAVPVGIGIVSDWVLTEVNERFCEITGYTKLELIGKNTQMLYPTKEEHQYAGREQLRQLKSRGTSTIETYLKCKNGETAYVLINSAPLNSEDLSVGFTFAVLDISARKQAEETLRKREERYREFFEEDLSGTYISSPEGELIDCNQEYKRIFGFDNTRHAKQISVVQLFQNPNERIKFLNRIKNEKRVTNHETVFETIDGDTVHVLENASGVFDKNGNLKQIKGFLLDITEQRKLESQLLQSQKLEAIGTLAGGIAHDFNNILSGIFGYSQLADMNINNPVKSKVHIRQIMKGAKRAAELVQQILTFSRKSEYQKHSFAIYIAVNEALNLLRSSLPSTIEIQKKIDSKAMVFADPTKIHQVIMNLCTNAYHAMKKTGGQMTVSLTKITVINQKSLNNEIMPPGNYLKLTVDDTGHGMDKTTLEKAFDPYFSTKKSGEGTGLGLALVQAIVEEHDGFLDVISTPDKGSQFNIYFPVITEIGEPAVTDVEADFSLQGHERIMFVDDEESIRLSIGNLLEDNGYTVQLFQSGEEALNEFKNHPHHFDLIITDMTMPGITGDQLAVAFLSIRPDIPIMLCTGYSEKISEAKALELGIKKYFQKPIVYQKLLFFIREVLDTK